MECIRLVLLKTLKRNGINIYRNFQMWCCVTVSKFKKNLAKEKFKIL